MGLCGRRFPRKKGRVRKGRGWFGRLLSGKSGCHARSPGQWTAAKAFWRRPDWAGKVFIVGDGFEGYGIAYAQIVAQ